MRAIKEAVLVLYNGDNEPLAFVKRDEVSKKVVFYSSSEMVMDDIEKLINKSDDRKSH